MKKGQNPTKNNINVDIFNNLCQNRAHSLKLDECGAMHASSIRQVSSPKRNTGDKP